MRRPGTRNPVIRVVLALLALVAAVAYQFRATPTGSHEQMTGPHMAQAPHSHAHHNPAAHTGPEHPAGAGHAAHCLFCVTGAFGVAVALPAAFRRGQVTAAQPDDLPAPLTFERTWTALARAPPSAA